MHDQDPGPDAGAGAVPAHDAPRNRGHDPQGRHASAHATWYLWDGAAFIISTLTWTRKYNNLKRDPRVTLCIDGFQRHTQYVQVSGTAEIVEGDVAEATKAIIRKYEPDEETTQRHWDEAKADRVIIRLRPDRWQWRYPGR